MGVVDLNSDIGESFGSYHLGLDEEVIKHVTSVNIACGWHAGDPLIMEDTLREAMDKGVGVGAHPGYPDLLGFGRRSMDISPKEARAYMIYQLGALDGFARANKTKIQHMKLHGAFYNVASINPELAEEIINGILDFDKNIILLALSGSYIARRGQEKGLRVGQEVFADRAYNEDLTLVKRDLPGAIIQDTDQGIERIKRMILDGKVRAINGKSINIEADSICVHGDNPQAISFLKKIKKDLTNEGIKFKALDRFI